MRQNALMQVQGLVDASSTQRVMDTLQSMQGVESVKLSDRGTISIAYDGSYLTVMDLIRAVRKLGFLASMT
ncbi:MAG: heavy metal-associated domain-containing protein [Deinococcaceae bacterium]